MKNFQFVTFRFLIIILMGLNLSSCDHSKKEDAKSLKPRDDRSRKHLDGEGQSADNGTLSPEKVDKPADKDVILSGLLRDLATNHKIESSELGELGRLSGADLEYVLNGVLNDSRSFNEKRVLLQSVLSELAKRDSGNFVAVVDKLPPGENYASLVSAAVRDMKADDLSLVLKKSKELAYPEFREVIEVAIVTKAREGIQKGDISLTPEMMRDFKSSGITPENLAAILVSDKGTRDRDLNEVLGYSKMFDDPKSSQDFMKAIAFSYPGKIGMDLVDSILPKEGYRDSGSDKVFVVNFSRKLAMQEPSQAEKWAASNVDKPWGGTAVKSVYSAMVEADPMQTSKAVAAMPQGIAKDYASVALVKYCVSQGSVEEGQSWLNSISNPSARKEAESLINNRIK